jgi:hypothetical protein
MGRKNRAGRRCAGPAGRHRRRVAARFRAAQQRHQGHARSICPRRQCLYRAWQMADGICHSRRDAHGMGAVAFDRGDAPDRIPDGLGMVEAVARGGAADRWHGRDLETAFRRWRRRHAVHSARRRGRALSCSARRPEAGSRSAASRPGAAGSRSRRRQQQLGARAAANRDRKAIAGG